MGTGDRPGAMTMATMSLHSWWTTTPVWWECKASVVCTPEALRRPISSVASTIRGGEGGGCSRFRVSRTLRVLGIHWKRFINGKSAVTGFCWMLQRLLRLDHQIWVDTGRIS